MDVHDSTPRDWTCLLPLLHVASGSVGLKATCGSGGDTENQSALECQANTLLGSCSSSMPGVCVSGGMGKKL